MGTKTALITGVTGQDGSYLAELLLEKGYLVNGLIRRSSSFNTGRIDHLLRRPGFTLHYGDMTDGAALSHLISNRIFPDEVYNLAAQSHVKVSFDLPGYTMDVGALGNLRLLEAVKEYKQRSVNGYGVRFYQASSSEMFGSTPPPQNEESPFHPRSPYAVGKVAAYHMSVHYREAYGLFTANGILFNHESERRGETFVTRKISRAVGRIYHGLQDKLWLGNVDARRDWGHARDYVKAMWLMLQADEPGDYVVATGESHTVGEFVERAFGHVGLDWRKHVVIGSTGYMRPTEVDHLCGDASKAHRDLGWKPAVSFDQLVSDMVDHDMELAQRELHQKSFKTK